MDVLEDDKKSLKKWLIRKRNRHNWLIFQHVAQIRDQQQAVREEEVETQKRLSQKSLQEADNNEVWSAKTQEIRNKLNGRKREAKERWNRFSGTEDGGGRGL